MIYVTYIEGGVTKKATLNEERMSALQSNPNIINLTIYSSPMLQEQAYQAMIGAGGAKRRTLLD